MVPVMVWRMSTVTFDTLSFSKRLQAAGVPAAQAEAHAQAQADFLTGNLLSQMATKEDIRDMVTRDDIRDMVTRDDIRDMVTKEDIRDMVTKEDIRDMATKQDIQAIYADMQSIREEAKHLEARLRMEMQLLGKTLTVRLGGIVALGVGALAALAQL